MRSQSSAIKRSGEAVGVALGAVGVVVFSLTLPATRAAVPVFGPWTVGIGRAAVAGLLAGACLAATRSPRPPPDLLPRLALVAGGVIIGFPVLTAIALQHAPASRGAVVVGVLPAATALAATARNGERPSRRFWLAAGGGLATVVVFAAVTGQQGRPGPADALFLGAVAAAAVGYAEGAAASARLGGWQTISWALVLSLPVSVPVGLIALIDHGVTGPTAGAVVGLVYVSVFSMFLGFFAWYAGLVRGGVARVSQIQLLQPVLTLGWSVLLLDEEVTVAALVSAGLVLAFVAAARRAPVARADRSAPPGPASVPATVPVPGIDGVATGSAGRG